MAALSLIHALGRDARSFEETRRFLGLPRPLSVRQLINEFDRTVTFEGRIITEDGVALGGSYRLTLNKDGSYTYAGSLRATGWPSYDVSFLTLLNVSIPVPGGAPPASSVYAFAENARVHGTNEPGNRDHHWEVRGTLPLLSSSWGGVRRSQPSHEIQYDTDWFGTLGGIAGLVAQVVAVGATLGGTAVAIVLAGAAADQLNLEQLVIPGTVGVIISGGAAFLLGPGVLVPALIVGTVVTSALIKQRPLSDEEKEFAQTVFGQTLPFESILLTNLVGLGGRPFTVPVPGGAILVNLGEGYNDPVRYTGMGAEDNGNNAAGQLLIHELTHAWQIANHSFTPSYYCRAVSTAAGTLGGDMSAYSYGLPGPSWNDFGTESQGSIVDEWFAGKNFPAKRGPQKCYGPMDSSANPYYRYIRDNIRAGIT